MCLYTVVDAVPSVAEHDIEVYKVVKVSNYLGSSGNGVAGRFYRSPYMRHYYDIGETYKSGFSSYKRMLHLYHQYEFANNVTELLTTACDGGAHIGIVERGLHSFASLDEAKGFCGICHHDGEGQYAVLRCVIPAGTEFYSGRWVHRGTGTSLVYVDSYASSALKVIEEITESV